MFINVLPEKCIYGLSVQNNCWSAVIEIRVLRLFYSNVTCDITFTISVKFKRFPIFVCLRWSVCIYVIRFRAGKLEV